MDFSDVSPKLIPDKKIIRRIPGHVPTPSAKEKDTYVDLKKMSIPALRELLHRQVAILANRLIVNKLADKGERVSMLKKHIENELKDRDEVIKTTSLLSQMTLQQLNELEWTSNVNTSKKAITVEDRDDEQDPLHIIASHSGVYNNEKLIRLKQSSDILIKQADLVDCTNASKHLKDGLITTPERGVSPAPSTLSVTSDLELHTVRICEKYDETTGKDRFKPNKLPNSKLEILENKRTISREKKKSSLWEESSAAPPSPVHGDTKLLTLQESLALQQEQTEKLKYVQTKHAAERLMSLQGIKSDTHLSSSVASSMAFREKKHYVGESDDEASDSANEEHEVFDDEPDDGPTVVCTVLT